MLVSSIIFAAVYAITIIDKIDRVIVAAGGGGTVIYNLSKICKKNRK